MFGINLTSSPLALGLTLVGAVACRSPLPASAPAGAAVPREPVSVAVVQPTPATHEPERAPAPVEPISGTTDDGKHLQLRGPGSVAADDGSRLDKALGGVDWTSVANMNQGMPSLMELGGSWGMSLSSGMDRLEECEPTLALTRHGPGFTDTFVFLAAHYKLSRSAHLVGRVAGIRAQDEALSDVVGDANVSAFTLGLYMHF